MTRMCRSTREPKKIKLDGDYRADSSWTVDIVEAASNLATERFLRSSTPALFFWRLSY